jgi:hypothetical protein
VLEGSVAYCCQLPWIIAATLQDNIVFGLPLDSERYRRVVQACALEQDIQELPGGAWARAQLLPGCCPAALRSSERRSAALPGALSWQGLALHALRPP